MSNQQKAVWGGGHTFFVYSADLKDWNDVPGVYIFAGAEMGRWHAKYIGQTSSFMDRMSNEDDLWVKAQELGATHIHAKVVLSPSARTDLEQALVGAYTPPLNAQI